MINMFAMKKNQSMCSFVRVAQLVLVLISTSILPMTLAQELPCPPPLLETVVDTQEKCACFYSLVGSGLDLGNSDTFSSVFNNNSVQNIAQTGQYVGTDGIAEYLSFVKGGTDGIVKDYILIGQQLFLDMTGTTMEQCIATVAERRRLPFNSFFTSNNQEICVDTVVGSTLYYTLTGNPAAPITIQTVNAWLPDEVASVTSSYVVDAPATVEFVCDTIVNVCGDNGTRRELKKKGHKKTKGPKQSKSMKECIKKYNALPLNDNSGSLNYSDGNSKSCRNIHAFFARTNPLHCPHISFEAEEDANGIVKCNESKQTLLTDLFSEQQLGLFAYAGTLLDLPKTIDIKLEACPGF